MDEKEIYRDRMINYHFEKDKKTLKYSQNQLLYGMIKVLTTYRDFQGFFIIYLLNNFWRRLTHRNYKIKIYKSFVLG